MIYSVLYVFVFSVALVLIQKLDISIPPLFSLLITSVIASLYFNIININNLKKVYIACFKNLIQWFSVMIIVLAMWATTMIGPGKIGASLFNFIYFAWLGMLGFVLLSLKNWKKYRIQFYFGVCLFLLVMANIFFELRETFSHESIYGIVLALIGGTSSFIYFKKSQVFSKNSDLSATQILSVRFYLAIVVLVIFLPKSNALSYFTVSNCFSLAFLALFSLIIPLYFSQKALEKITSEQHAIINSSCPIVTGILQKVIFNDITKEQMTIYFIYVLLFILFYFINNNYNKKMEIL